MAQLGLHGLLGLALGKNEAFRALEAPARHKLTFAFILGGLLPDADLYLLGPLYLFHAKLGAAMHRTFTHSLLLALCVYALTRLARRKETRAFGTGLALGMTAHIALDVLIWFSPVTLLWPLNYLWPGVATVDLWAAVRPHEPDVLRNLLGAFDYIFLALYSLALQRMGKRFGEDAGFLPKLRWLTYLQGAVGAVYCALAFFLKAGTFDLFTYALFIPIFLSLALYTTIKMRATLGHLAETPPVVKKTAAAV